MFRPPLDDSHDGGDHGRAAEGNDDRGQHRLAELARARRRYLLQVDPPTGLLQQKLAQIFKVLGRRLNLKFHHVAAPSTLMSVESAAFSVRVVALSTKPG